MIEEKVVRKVQRRVATALKDAGPTKNKLLIVAVSGGPDSLALLYSLHTLRDSLGFRLHGAHLDHGLRGAEAEEDARFVAETFQSLSLPFTVERADVPSFRAERHLSLEEAARKVRYTFLGRVASEVQADAVVLGHTADDQAETVLMNILRGTGLTGLRGMAPLTLGSISQDMPEVALLRPLLEVIREETEAYCRARGLCPRRDETNLSTDFTRNRLRHELLPQLQQYNPSIKEALRRLSRSAAQDMAYLEKGVDRAWAALVNINKEPQGLTLNRKAFSSLDPAIQHHLLRRAVSQVKGDLEDVEQNHIQDMARLMKGRPGKSLNLPGRVSFSVSYESATLALAQEDLCPLPTLEGEHKLKVPGQTVIGDWRVDCSLITPDGTPQEDIGEPRGGGDSYAAVLSLETVGSHLWVRTRQPGDRFQPLGMAQDKKLQDFMVDAKIPRSWRDRVPLVVSPAGIVCVVGYRIADWARVDEGTSKKIRLRFQR